MNNLAKLFTTEDVAIKQVALPELAVFHQCLFLFFDNFSVSDKKCGLILGDGCYPLNNKPHCYDCYALLL